MNLYKLQMKIDSPIFYYTSVTNQNNLNQLQNGILNSYGLKSEDPLDKGILTPNCSNLFLAKVQLHKKC